MKTFTLGYCSVLVVMLGLDSIWLTATADPLYRAQIGALMLPAFKPVPAIAFYRLYVVGVVVFAVLPALAVASWRFAASRGALLGCVAYATYDLTNQATLRGWSTMVTLADLMWGTTLTATAASVGYVITRRLLGRANRSVR